MGLPRWKECTLVLTEARREESVASERRAQGAFFEAVDESGVGDVNAEGETAEIEEETAEIEGEMTDIEKVAANVEEEMADVEKVAADVEEEIVDVEEDRVSVEEVTANVKGETVDIEEETADIEEDAADIEEEVRDEGSMSTALDISSFGGSDGFCWSMCPADWLSSAVESASAAAFVWLRSSYMASTDSAAAD